MRRLELSGDGVANNWRGDCGCDHPGTLCLYGGLMFGSSREALLRERHMNGLIYLIGLIVVILAILSFFGLR
jgi:hypothetical protein